MVATRELTTPPPLAANLRATRTRLGLTQAQAAGLLATSQANLSAYERGGIEPGPLVRERLEAFTHLPTNSLYSTYLASTIPSAAAQLRADIHANRSESDMLRIVIQASDDFAYAQLKEDRTFFLSEPSPTGSRKWDALLAGLAVHLCREANMDRTPMWATNPSLNLDSIWWFDSSAPSLHAYALREAIPSMRARGVMFSRRNLESV